MSETRQCALAYVILWFYGGTRALLCNIAPNKIHPHLSVPITRLLPLRTCHPSRPDHGRLSHLSARNVIYLSHPLILTPSFTSGLLLICHLTLLPSANSTALIPPAEAPPPADGSSPGIACCQTTSASVLPIGIEEMIRIISEKLGLVARF